MSSPQQTEDGGPAHLKGRIVPSDGYLYREGGGEPICQFWDKHEDDYNNAESNAHHLAACWNALAGMNPEALGEVVKTSAPITAPLLELDRENSETIQITVARTDYEAFRTALALLTARKGTR